MRSSACTGALVFMVVILAFAGAHAEPRRIVIAARAPGDPIAGPLTTLGARPLLPGLAAANLWIAEAPDSVAAARVVGALGSDPRVAWAEIEQPRTPTLDAMAPPRAVPVPVDARRFPSDPMFVDTRQWGLANAGASGAYGGMAGADIHAHGAWLRSTGNNDLRLALIDTGIDIGHPELATRLADGSSRIVDAVDLADGLPVMADSFGHGTLVAGVMAARTHEGAHFDSLGVAGVCGGDGRANIGCRLIPIRVTRGHGNTASSIDVARAILHAAAHGARAVNLSLAGSAPSRFERLALAEALARGTVVVAAAGNRGFNNGDAAMYPAAYAADGLCVQVGASDPWDRRAVFSSHGPGLDVVAPGVDIWTTFMTYPSAAGADWGGYAVAAGTSLAAPFVTGTIGLLCAARPELIDTDLQQVLRMSADDLDPPGPDRWTGWGRLNAARALALVERDQRIAHRDVRAESWQRMSDGMLMLGETGVPILDRLARAALAERWEVTARIAIPDSIADSCRAWTRVTGTTTLRDGFDLPYLTPHATVSRIGRRMFTVRGSVYRLIDPRLADTTRVPRALLADSASLWIPAPPERMTFAVTLLGGPRTQRGPTASPAPALVASAAHGGVRFQGRPGGRVEIFDVTGRRVAQLDLSADGAATWDDPGLPPGVFLARAGGRATRIVRLP